MLTKNIYMFGTKPNGTAYAAQFAIEPWAVPTPTNSAGSLGDFVQKINNSLVQGSERFASARLENGNLVVSSVGSGDAFSIFFALVSNFVFIKLFNNVFIP